MSPERAQRLIDVAAIFGTYGFWAAGDNLWDAVCFGVPMAAIVTLTYWVMDRAFPRRVTP